MAKVKILIAVKTYPTLSGKYDELVCTAGFKEDGSWIRIYPIPFRKLNDDSQYKKWQWITIDLKKNTKDFRIESYKPTNIDDDIVLGEKVSTKNCWAERKKIALHKVWTNMNDLIKDAKEKNISLAVVKPTKVIDFIYESTDREWDKKILAKIKTRKQQLNLFSDGKQDLFQVVKKLPYKFSYIFETEDGEKRTLMIEDWELGMLYWKCLEKENGNELVACEKVKKKYFYEMLKDTDFYFLMGTTLKWHKVSPNPFVIIGTFYPKKGEQLSLAI